MKPLTEHEYALRLRKMYDENLNRHVIESRAILDAGRAVFVIRRPGEIFYWAEIAMLGYGTVMVHGDVSTVVFGGCSSRTWQEKLHWLEGDNYSYAEEKASIGTSCSEMARGFDDEVAKGDILRWRRQKRIRPEAARQALEFVDEGDYRMAQQTLWEEDYELGLGQCIAPRVIMAQAAITKLCALLAAEAAPAAVSA